MPAPRIQSAKRLSTLIFADRISGDKRGLAFPTSGFPGSALAHGACGSAGPAFRVPEQRTANQPLEATGGSAEDILRFLARNCNCSLLGDISVCGRLPEGGEASLIRGGLLWAAGSYQSH